MYFFLRFHAIPNAAQEIVYSMPSKSFPIFLILFSPSFNSSVLNLNSSVITQAVPLEITPWELSFEWPHQFRVCLRGSS